MNEIERQLIEKYEAEGFGAAKKFYESNQNKINNLEKRDSLLVTSQMLRMCALNNDNEFAETITKPNSTNNGGDDMKCICVKNWKKVRAKHCKHYSDRILYQDGHYYSGILQFNHIMQIEKFNGRTNPETSYPKPVEDKDCYLISLKFCNNNIYSFDEYFSNEYVSNESNDYIFSWNSKSERDAVYDKLVKFLNCETF